MNIWQQSYDSLASPAFATLAAAQSIVVATSATGWYGHGSDIIRRVFAHGIVLVVVVGVLVYLQAYVYPFTWLVESAR